MQRPKLILIGLGVAAVLALSGCASQSMAAQTTTRASSNDEAQTFAASEQLAPFNDKNGPDKGGKGGKDDKSKKDDKNKDAKGNNGNKANDGDRGNSGNKANNVGQAEHQNPSTAGHSTGPGNGSGNQPPSAGRGLGAWWRNFRASLFGGATELNLGGWQRGRFKDAFPFAHPAGWAAQQRGDALLLTGPWQGGEYVFQMTRSIQVDARSLEEWVAGDLQQLGLGASNVRYAQAGRVQIAVVTGVREPAYACPVAYVYLWTANPAGNNQRQALGVISQAPGSTCNPAGLNAFVDAYLAQVGDDEDGATLATPSPSPTATASPPTVSPTATQPPATATPTGGNANWQRTRFFNAFSFAYPNGWSMDRLGDTAHLQGEYQGRGYLADLVWVRNAPQVGLEQWARADLNDLGADMEGVRIDYAPQGNDAQIAVVSGIRIQGYQCPVVRMYVLANNTAGGGQRAYTVTVAQANGQACDPQALENLAYQMVQQA